MKTQPNHRNSLFRILPSLLLLPVVFATGQTPAGSTTAAAPAADASEPAAATAKSNLLASGLAFGKKVTASSIYDAKHPQENAVDGDPATYWSSEFTDSAWLAVDLGEPKKVGRVVIYWEHAYAKAFSIQISTDGQNWTDVYKTEASIGGISEIKFPTVEAQYLRLNCIKRGTPWGNGVLEIQVFE